LVLIQIALAKSTSVALASHTLTHKERDRERTERDTERNTERNTERDRERQRERHTHTHTNRPVGLDPSGIALAEEHFSGVGVTCTKIARQR
jgi:Ni/Co efflux regulator RcnB